MKCQDCGVKSDDVVKTTDPMQGVINDDKKPKIKVCPKCLRDRCDEV